MAEYTEHYSLKKLGQGESLSDDSYKFVGADRELIDHVLWLGAESHKHTGGAATAGAPTTGATLQLVTTSGTLPAGRRVYYKYTYVDSNGMETGESPEVFIDTPAQVASPAKPTLTFATTGGTLLTGSYYYVLSAYKGSNINETPAINPEVVAVASTTSTNTITITLPALPVGADGFNIYRQAPNGPGYFFIASVDMTVTTPPTTYVDTGAVAPNCDRTRPTVNTTQQTNSVILTISGPVAAGSFWRIYRTLTVGNYVNSLLATVSGPTLTYTDTGATTTIGQPPVAGVAVGSPAKIQLTDAGEVQGRLPLSSVSAFPHVVTFSLEGAVFTLTGTTPWVCEFPQATILGVRASLGRGSTPAATPVIVDINRGKGLTPTYTSIFTAQADQPRVLVGNQVGARVVPTAVTELEEGDSLTVDVDQAGGGGTPTDRDLVVQVYLSAYGWMSTTSHAWAPLTHSLAGASAARASVTGVMP